jgi:hypothetical protein
MPAEEAVATQKTARSESPGHLSPDFGDLLADRVEEPTVVRYASILGLAAIEVDKEGDASSYCFIPLPTSGRTYSLRVRERESPGRQPSVSVLAGGRSIGSVRFEMVIQAMRAYEYASARKRKLTSPSEVLQTIRGFKVGKSPFPSGIPNRILRHLPKGSITFLTCFCFLSLAVL